MIEDSAIPVKARSEPLVARADIDSMLEILALKGYPTAAGDLRSYIDDLEARNAALLEAARLAIACSCGKDDPNRICDACRCRLERAITQAEGKAVPNG